MKNDNYNLWGWGFTKGAENWNGRLAMVGFIAVVITELITGKSILDFLAIL